MPGQHTEAAFETVIEAHLLTHGYARIARALGCREGTIKSRVHRGKDLMRQDLRTYWKGETG